MRRGRVAAMVALGLAVAGAGVPVAVLARRPPAVERAAESALRQVEAVETAFATAEAAHASVEGESACRGWETARERIDDQSSLVLLELSPRTEISA